MHLSLKVHFYYINNLVLYVSLTAWYATISFEVIHGILKIALIQSIYRKLFYMYSLQCV